MRAFVPLLSLAALLVACGAEDSEEHPATEAPSAAAPPTSVAASSVEGDWWRPAPSSTWQWQLQGEANTSYDVEVYDIDLFDSDRALIETPRGAQRSRSRRMTSGSTS